MNANEKMRYIEEYLNSYSNITSSTRWNKNFIITRFLNYINEKGVELKELKEIDIINYIFELKSKNNYKTTTMNHHRTQIKLFLNWTFEQNLTLFSGYNVCKNARTGYRENIITSYDENEIQLLLDSIDTSNKIGKLRNAIMSIFIYYGMRVSDVINLKFENIDWENNKISIIQQKTNQPLNLPLIDNIKFSLLDYIKNGRNNSMDKEHLFIRIHKPYTKYTKSGIYSLIQKTFKDAKIDIKNRHHGSHSLRSSLATNMLKNNIPLGDISQVLGHATIKTTEQYISKDITHLKELALEVPYE